LPILAIEDAALPGRGGLLVLAGKGVLNGASEPLKVVHSLPVYEAMAEKIRRITYATIGTSGARFPCQERDSG
jgi:hypothetical protein